MAVVVPDVDVLKCWAQENNINGTLSVLCNNPAVKELIMNDMLMWGKQIGLKTFEQVSNCCGNAPEHFLTLALCVGCRR